MAATFAESAKLVTDNSGASMKAIVQNGYGNPEAVLGFEVVAKPIVGDGEVLVHIHAASVHIGDWMLVMGVPYIARPAYGLLKPKSPIPGTDIAGTIEAIGNGVTEFRPGDEVLGWCTGAFAEYASAPESHFVLKPASLTFEQAAAIGVSASTALQLLRDQGRIQPGQKVLINGASGGLGTYAVQIAKAFGAEVTGVCSTKNVEMVSSIGADHVIDYLREDFTESGQRYDFILDNVANHSLPDIRRALTPKGKLQSNNGTRGGRWFGTMGTVIKTAVGSMYERQQLGPAIKFPTKSDLVALTQLIEAKKVTPVIDRTYPVQSAADAVAYVGRGHAKGTVVINV
jgi:NADPH:quinone reductase-like Zn-dependent oxidoreductase